MSAHTSKNMLIYKDTNIEQKDQLECQKKIIRVLKDKYTNKENPLDSTRKNSVKENASKIVKAKYKKTTRKDDETQTSPKVQSKEDSKNNDQQHKGITVEDLTEGSPSEHYWERLAKKRQLALEEALQENQRLRQHIEGLENELKLTKKEFEETKNLVEILNEIIGENEVEDDIAQSKNVKETEEEELKDVDAVVEESHDGNQDAD